MQYKSSQQTILKTAEDIFNKLSDFTNFDAILSDKVENWQATKDRCSFKAEGFDMALEIVERTQFSTIKIQAAKGESPIPLSVWIQLKQVEPYETRLRLVLDVELNMMLKMMIGSKLQKGVDNLAEGIAKALEIV